MLEVFSYLLISECFPSCLLQLHLQSLRRGGVKTSRATSYLWNCTAQQIPQYMNYCHYGPLRSLQASFRITICCCMWEEKGGEVISYLVPQSSALQDQIHGVCFTIIIFLQRIATLNTLESFLIFK